jgi:hypothetical protein
MHVDYGGLSMTSDSYRPIGIIHVNDQIECPRKQRVIYTIGMAVDIIAGSFYASSSEISSDRLVEPASPVYIRLCDSPISTDSNVSVMSFLRYPSEREYGPVESIEVRLDGSPEIRSPVTLSRPWSVVDNTSYAVNILVERRTRKEKAMDTANSLVAGLRSDLELHPVSDCSPMTFEDTLLRKRRSRRKKLKTLGLLITGEPPSMSDDLLGNSGPLLPSRVVHLPARSEVAENSKLSSTRVVKKAGTRSRDRHKPNAAPSPSSSSSALRDENVRDGPPQNLKEAGVIKIMPHVSLEIDNSNTVKGTIFLKGNSFDFHSCVEELFNYFEAMGVFIDCIDYGPHCYQIDYLDKNEKMAKWLSRRTVLDLSGQNFTICRNAQQFSEAQQPVSLKPLKTKDDGKSYKILKGVRVKSKKYRMLAQVSGVPSHLRSNPEFADKLSSELSSKLTCLEFDASSAVWYAQEDALLSCVTMRANRLYGMHSYFSVKVPFLGTDHYVDVNIASGTCKQIEGGDYPDFYINSPAYNIGEKRVYAQKVKEHLLTVYPKNSISVMAVSARVNGRKGTTPALAVYGCDTIPQSILLGTTNLKVSENLECLVSEIRAHKPTKVLRYTLSIKVNSSPQVLSDALKHLMSSDGGDNFIGHYFDGRSEDPGRHVFLVSSQITANPDFLFQPDPIIRGASAKKTHVSSSPPRGSQI